MVNKDRKLNFQKRNPFLTNVKLNGKEPKPKEPKTTLIYLPMIYSCITPPKTIPSKTKWKSQGCGVHRDLWAGNSWIQQTIMRNFHHCQPPCYSDNGPSELCPERRLEWSNSNVLPTLKRSFKTSRRRHLISRRWLTFWCVVGV